MIAPAPTAGTGLRWARAVAIATTAWGTASAAHLIGGGHSPAVAVVLALIVLTAWPLTLSLRARASRRRIVVLLGAGQLLMHVAFVLISAWTTVGAPAGTAAAHGEHGTPVAGSIPAAGSAAHAMPILPGPAMLLAHLAAATLVGCVLATGERALFSLLGVLRQLARPGLRVCDQVLRVLAGLLTGAGRAVPAALTTTWTRDDTGPRRPQYLLVRAVLRRGPPVLLHP